MAAFAGYYQASLNPISLISKIKELKHDAITHLPDRQYSMLTPGDGLDGSDSSEAITTEATKVSNAADNVLLHLYESAMEFFGLQETVNLTMLGDEQVAAAALYGPSIGVHHGEQPVYPRTKSLGREEKNCCNGNHLLYHHTPGNGSAMEVSHVKNDRETDPYSSKSVSKTNLPVHLKKSESDRCKSWPSSSPSGDREKKTNPELEVIRSEPREFLSNIVTKERKAESRKDYIHVRARRGQATDRHSLAERVRRRKLNDRMNTLQNIVPGCNKITNKALVLEEIINYVQLLQKEVEVLSMKLASISPIWTFDHQISGHPFKE